MTNKTRRFILYLAFIFFVLVVPPVLFYAWGYSFDWESKKLVLTGGLYLRSIPEDAQIFFNDKPKKETPTFIKHLSPKDYQIRIEKEGFHSWQKKLKIESRLVTEAKNILLIPDEIKIEEIDQKFPNVFSLNNHLNPEKPDETFFIQKQTQILYQTNSDGITEQISLTPLPKGNYQVFVSNNKRVAVLNGAKELYLYNPETRAFELISRDISGLEFSSDNQKLLFYTPNEIWVYYLEDIFEQPNKKADEKELITRLSQRISNVIWYGATNQHIIFSIGQDIKVTELDGRDQRNTFDLIKLDFEQIGYNPEDKGIYFFKQGKLSRFLLEEE